jgi:hypothetical protein
MTEERLKEIEEQATTLWDVPSDIAVELIAAVRSLREEREGATLATLKRVREEVEFQGCSWNYLDVLSLLDRLEKEV